MNDLTRRPAAAEAGSLERPARSSPHLPRRPLEPGVRPLAMVRTRPSFDLATNEAGPTLLRAVQTAVRSKVVGQEALVERTLICLLNGGHVLLEGAPGTAKTTLTSLFAQLFEVESRRVQITPDALPGTILGSEIPVDGSWVFKKGPVFTDFLVVDELNRGQQAPAALLQCMAERAVTVAGEALPLRETFWVMATQNADDEGTYPLPAANLDRFMMKLQVAPLSARDQQKVGEQALSGRRSRGLAVGAAPQRPLRSTAQLLEYRDALDRIHFAPELSAYATQLIRATDPQLRTPRQDAHPVLGRLAQGVGLRAQQDLMQAAQARAFLRGRNLVRPEDLEALLPDVLRHRLPSYESLSEVVAALLEAVSLGDFSESESEPPSEASSPSSVEGARERDGQMPERGGQMPERYGQMPERDGRASEDGGRAPAGDGRTLDLNDGTADSFDRARRLD